ncbi:luciferin sulfotransferase-like [Schistocerca gregaria]|uniref:luciferin sulfotransferase-like n=1 Tax=Schistocerca gregaria TaxID=7010 RepID=UPI00211ED4B7|nr:luciferin sulfotransferase-like [Schistocerca gregaria]
MFQPKFEKMQDEFGLRVAAACPGIFKSPLWRVIPSRSVVTSLYPDMWQRFTNFEVYPDDVWVVTFPKCGTTWTQEMVWLIGNDCDFETAKKKKLNERVPFIEFVAISRYTGPDGDTLQRCTDLPRPRFIKSHLPYELLPQQLWTKKPKIIYVARDPKDTALSYYHHHRLWNGYTGTLDDFLEAFIQDALVYCPFWEHVLRFWELRDEPHVLFNTFEEMTQDLSAVVRRTADFMGRQLSDEQVSALCEHLSFSKMRENPAVNHEEGPPAESPVKGATVAAAAAAAAEGGADGGDPALRFMRRGKAGGWRQEMPAAFIDKFDRWTEQKTAGTGFRVGVSGGHQ